jgi:hypothetical protein
VEPELLTIPEHLSSPPVVSGVCVAQFLVFCGVFVDHCTFFYGHCIECSSIYGFWLSLGYFQTVLVLMDKSEQSC